MSSNIGWKKKIFLKYKTKTKAIIITYANCDLKTFSDKIDKDFQKSLGNNCYIEINGKVIDTGRTLEDVLRAANTTALDCIVKDGQIPNPKSYNITINFEKNMTETPFQYELPISDTSDTIQWEKNYKELQKKIGNKLKNQYWESKYLLLDKANVNIDNGYDLAVAFDELNDLDAKGASPLVITFVVTKMKDEQKGDLAVHALPTSDDSTAFGPDATIPKNAESFELWCEISCVDQSGISIDNIKEGDLVSIESLSGIGSFAMTNLQILGGFVAIMAGLLQDGTSFYTATQASKTIAAIHAQAEKLKAALNKDIKHKRRDGYGQNPGSGNYGENEGGIIVCMPTAKGAIYATDENRLKDGAVKNGRLPEYFSDNIKYLKCFFPCNKSGGQMSAIAAQDGVINILAFDQKFSDNGGTYELKINITRKSEKLSYNGSRAKLEAIKLKYLLNR